MPMVGVTSGCRHRPAEDEWHPCVVDVIAKLCEHGQRRPELGPVQRLAAENVRLQGETSFLQASADVLGWCNDADVRTDLHGLAQVVPRIHPPVRSIKRIVAVCQADFPRK